MTGTAERARIVLADVEAAAARQVDVEQHEIRQLAIEGGDRRRGVGRLDHGIARIRQREGDQREQVRIVVDDEDFHGLRP